MKRHYVLGLLIYAALKICMLRWKQFHGAFMKEYRGKPTKFHEPTAQELKARGKRNIAIAVGLALFMTFVFVTMISRGVIPNVS